MVVGNLPIAGQKWPAVDHAARVARFALEAVSSARQVRGPGLNSDVRADPVDRSY